MSYSTSYVCLQGHYSQCRLILLTERWQKGGDESRAGREGKWYFVNKVEKKKELKHYYSYQHIDTSYYCYCWWTCQRFKVVLCAVVRSAVVSQSVSRCQTCVTGWWGSGQSNPEVTVVRPAWWRVSALSDSGRYHWWHVEAPHQAGGICLCQDIQCALFLWSF